MALIKQSDISARAQDAIVLDFDDLSVRAERILEEARNQAQAIVQEARVEAKRLTDEAAAKGFDEGERAGRAEGLEAGRAEGRAAAIETMEQALQGLCESWQAAITAWEASRRGMLLELRDDALRFAIAVAEQIIHRAIQVDPTLVLDQVAEALRLVARPSAVKVAVHPDDLALIEDTVPDLLGKLSHCEHIDAVSDPSIERGGCYISTAGGSIDARIGMQIERIARALLSDGSLMLKAGDERLNDEA